MQRLTISLAVALLTFCCGVLAWVVNPVRLVRSHPSESIRLTVSEMQSANSRIPIDHYKVTVENVSSNTIHGYSLGFTCDCYGPYPKGISFTYPNPDRQLLKPGEVQTEILPADLPIQQTKVWVDLVHFTDGSNWGPNQSRTEGYVRALE
jgi:hypothetical protein